MSRKPNRKEKGPVAADPILNTSSRSIMIKPKPEGKLDSMLRQFAHGRRFHRFNAEIVGDHTLPSTISSLQKRHGIHFDRMSVPVPNRFGSKTTVSQYWLQGEDLTKAQRYCGIGREGVE